MIDPTPMEEITENIDLVIAGLVAEASKKVLPDQVEILMVTFCANLTPAEA
jgi:hypothetical protein|tara:strand:- start:474 stop:626 length:153 start_codon:yes stop_codon:yes gene_type:complete